VPALSYEGAAGEHGGEGLPLIELEARSADVLFEAEDSRAGHIGVGLDTLVGLMLADLGPF
jgi:hypothetical protein